MKLAIYQVDAFTTELFKGNPAAVVPLKEWLPDQTMQNIALENNLSETAFFVNDNNAYHIRWFTPSVEVPLCGHATLATSYVIYNFIDPYAQQITFESRSGQLIISRDNSIIHLNFPENIPDKTDPPKILLDAMGIDPVEVLLNKSFLAILADEDQVRQMKPDFTLLSKLKEDGLIISAKGKSYDFVSRYFVPNAGIDEDPVTGYAHTLLTPYWSKKLGKSDLRAYQASERGGEVFVRDLKNGRVQISGKAVLYMKGEIEV
ncbi:MAG: PhzF family phenazine biosynthesis protein [Melioribacteraceae bacterium]|nr:PhzF family phenazine biosynthesis protein [Melioribacteraceae bacterium]